ncbi:MAG: PHP domain-containing protein, partial [Smithellaceae bacterium]|nr:PHP domain-containing protein [Smithellaceae bacterium]
MILHDYSGIIHLHSKYSFDGRVPVPRIVAAAQANLLDFIMLTDHSDLRARTDGYEGWHDRCLL